MWLLLLKQLNGNLSTNYSESSTLVINLMFCENYALTCHCIVTRLLVCLKLMFLISGI